MLIGIFSTLWDAFLLVAFGGLVGYITGCRRTRRKWVERFDRLRLIKHQDDLINNHINQKPRITIT